METSTADQVNEKRKAEAILRRDARLKKQKLEGESGEFSQSRGIEKSLSSSAVAEDAVTKGNAEVTVAPVLSPLKAAASPPNKSSIVPRNTAPPEPLSSALAVIPANTPEGDGAKAGSIASATSVVNGLTPAGSQLTSPLAQPIVCCAEPQLLFIKFASELFAMTAEAMRELAKLLLMDDIPTKKAELHFKLANTTGKAQDLEFIQSTARAHGHFVFSNFEKQHFASPPQ